MAKDTETDADLENPLLAEIQARYKAARDHAAKWRTQAREDFRFYAGDQWDMADVSKMNEQQRPVVTFNRIMRLVNAVIGHEANNRAEVRYIPRTMGDAKVNELLTAAGKFFRDGCDADFEESDAFRDMLICGMGWTHDRLSDAQNPEYDLIEERVDPIQMLWDPSSLKPNLADARYCFRRKRYTEKEIKTIWPEWNGVYADLLDSDIEDDDGDVVDRSPRSAYRGDGENKDVRPDILVLEYQYKQREGYYVIAKPGEGGEATTFELPATQMDEELKAKLQERSVQMSYRRRTVTRRCFVIGKTIVQEDVVCPDDFTYHCITGFRDREKHHWFGIVRMLKDPQKWSNKWLAQIMHIVNSNAKGGVMLEADAVDDRHAFEASWADPGAITYFAAGALKDGRAVPKPPPVYPTGVDKLLEYANNSFTDVSGVNQELLGLADREQAGVLEWQRKQSAVTLLAPLFDSLRRFRRIQGRVWLHMMQHYVSDGRIIRITTDQGEANIPFGGPPEAQAMLPPEWRLPETAEYDVIVDQAATAPNQKEQTWAVLSQLFPVMKEMIPPPAMMLALEYSPLPESFVAKLKDLQKQMAQQPPPPDPEMMKAQAQIEAKKAELQMRQQEAQMQAQLDMQKAQTQAEIDMAKARNDMEIERYKAEQQLEIERMKAAHQAQQMQQKMQLDRERADFDAGLDAERMNREGQMAEHKMSLEQQMAGAKMETDGAKTMSKGPISKLLDGLTDRQEKALATFAQESRGGSEQLAQMIGKLTETLSSDSQFRAKAFGEIMNRRGKRQMN